jgi:uncharacterized protein
VLSVLLEVVGGLLLLDVLVQASFARVFIPHFERRPHLRARPFPRRSTAGSFTVRTPDGLTLRGSVLRSRSGSPAGVVVFCHEFGGDRWSYQGHCPERLLATHDLVTFDFRHHGASDRERGYSPSHWLTEREVTDTRAVLAWVRSRPEWKDVPVTLIGVSRGANAALAAGEAAEGVVAVGAFSTIDLAFTHLLDRIERCAPLFLRIPKWHIRSTLALAIRWSGWRQGVRFVAVEKRIRSLSFARVLLIAGGADTHIPQAFGQALAGRVKGAQFWSVPNGRHNLERDAAPGEFDERVLGFLEELALTAGSQPSGSRRAAA